MRSTTALATVLGAAAGAAVAETDPWATLEEITIEEIVTETSYEARKTFPPALAGGVRDFRITGYAVPLSLGPEVTEIILVSDMGLCPFCGSGEHGATLQVSLADPIIGLEEGTRLSLSGDLQTVTDPTTWQAVILTGARLVSN